MEFRRAGIFGILSMPNDRLAKQREYSRRHDLKPERKAWKKRYRILRLETFKSLIQELKCAMGGCCACCGGTELLQFAHIDPDKKLFTVACGSAANISRVRIREEASKCRLLCRACHTDETREQYRDGRLRGNRPKPDVPDLGVQKRCSTCREMKDLSAFSPWGKRGPRRHQNNCKVCAAKGTNKRIAENKAYVLSLKICCVDCGSLEGLDFDHVRGTKFKAVSAMLSYKRSRIDEEIAKCEVVCGVCHKGRTAQRKAG